MAESNQTHGYMKASVIICLFLTHTIGKAEEQANQTKENKLTAHIVMSHSADFIGHWLSRNEHRQLPDTQVIKVEHGKKFYAAFLAKGLEGNHASRYQFDVDWKLYKPDGSVMFSEANYARGSGPLSEDPKFSLAYPSLYIVLDKTDPPGKYKLEAVVKDKVTQARAVDVYLFDFSH